MAEVAKSNCRSFDSHRPPGGLRSLRMTAIMGVSAQDDSAKDWSSCYPTLNAKCAFRMGQPFFVLSETPAIPPFRDEAAEGWGNNFPRINEIWRRTGLGSCFARSQNRDLWHPFLLGVFALLQGEVLAPP